MFSVVCSLHSLLTCGEAQSKMKCAVAFRGSGYVQLPQGGKVKDGRTKQLVLYLSKQHTDKQGWKQQSWHRVLRTSVRETEEAMATGRQVTRIISQTLVACDKARRSFLGCRAKEPRWMCRGCKCWTMRSLNQRWQAGMMTCHLQDLRSS